MSSSNMPTTWVSDIKSGFLVFLIALPLCLGISMASGFPPVAGVLTAIIGGIVLTFLGSSRLTIKGPAAGLIVIALGAVQELGQDDPMLGYRRALAVGAVAAALQIVFALFRAASVGVAMAPAVVHGMLAAIGVIIISKQAHTMLGVVPGAEGPIGLLLEIPKSLLELNPEIALLGGASLLILALMPLIRGRWAKLVPAPVVAIVITVAFGLIFDLQHAHDYHLLAHDYHVGPEFLVSLPGSLLGAVTFPDFSVIGSAASLKYIVMFALVGTIESTLSVLAVDAMDPQKRASNLNRDLLAVGVGNLACALIGGLPMISEIVRSKANIDAGAKSKWSNFFHGAFLLLFVAAAPTLLQMIPLAALAAMLVYTGARLASPGEFIHARQVGADQFAIFSTTFATTLATDLLVGVGVGLVLKIALHIARGVPIKNIIHAPVTSRREASTVEMTVQGAATFAALLPLRRELGTVGDDIDRVVIDVTDCVLADHTFLTRLEAMSQEWPSATLEYRGLETMQAASAHKLATRRRV